MNAKWIMQTNIFKEDAVTKMISAFERLEVPYELIKIIPFSDELPKVDPYDGPIIAYGTTTLLKNVKRTDWFPGMWFDEERFKPSYWGAKLGDLYLNKDARIMPLNKVVENWEGKNQFIRPDSDFKLFSGDVFSKYDFINWYENVCEQIDNGTYVVLKKDTPVSVAPYNHILAEWRIVIIDKEVVAYSRYRYLGILNVSYKQEDIPNDVIELALKIAKNDWQLAIAYVVDIAYVGTDYKIIEFNCLNASGFYKCDVFSIITHANKLAEKQWNSKK